MSSTNQFEIQTVRSSESIYKMNPQSPTSTLQHRFSEDSSKKKNSSIHEFYLNYDDMLHSEIHYCDSNYHIFEPDYATNTESSRSTYCDYAIDTEEQEESFNRKQIMIDNRERFDYSKQCIFFDQEGIEVVDDCPLIQTYSKASRSSQLMKKNEHKKAKRYMVSNKFSHPSINDVDEMIIHALQYEKAGSYKKALKFFDTVLDLKLRQYDEYPSENKCPQAAIDLSHVLHKYSMLQWKVGSYKKAIQYCFQALKLDDELHHIQRSNDLDLARAETYLCLGNSYLSLGNYKQALTYFRKSLKLRKLIHGCHDHPDVANSIICIGKVFEEKGRLHRAMSCYREGLRIQQPFIEDDVVGVAMTFNCVGVIHEKWRKYGLAMECYQQALSLFQMALGNDNVDVALTFSNIGQIYRHCGQYDEAMSSNQEALRIFNGLLGNHHRNVASTIHNIALIHAARNENIVAIKTFKKVLKLQKAVLGKIHADVAVTLDSLAEVYQKIGKIEKAEKVYSKALQVRCKAFGEKHLFVGISYHRLGLFQKENMSNYEDALLNLKEGLYVYRANSLTDENVRVTMILKNIAEIH